MTKHNSLDIADYFSEIKQRKETEGNIMDCLGIGFITTLANLKKETYNDPFTTESPEKAKKLSYQKNEIKEIKNFLKNFRKGRYFSEYTKNQCLDKLREIYGSLEKIASIEVRNLNSLDNLVKILIGKENIGYVNFAELLISDDLIEKLYNLSDIKTKNKKRIAEKIISRQTEIIYEHLSSSIQK